ncbi:DUF4333 domain-containing protein [Nocardioides sp. W7]|uniref:DUF4333 domain-containing protein n=1 Tax=Nocardioides sp. W7 TaxID=2931390 RepID=UPI001FD5EFCC|nr:DUF4333 domain-containing protein [Nocardioides sp. W7]
MNLRLRPPAAALALLATAVLTACSASVSVGDADAVSAEKLEQAIASKITVDGGEGDLESAGIDLTCDDELPAEVDASVDCFGTDADGGVTGFRPVVTAVDGTDVEFDAGLFLPGDTLAEQVGAQLAEQGYTVESLDCEEVDGEVGATSTCTAQVEGAAEPDELAITIEEVDGLRFRFGYEVAG